MSSIPESQQNIGTKVPATQRHLRLVNARQAALDAWPIWGSELPDDDQADVLDLSALLDLLGYTADEFVSISYKLQTATSRFTTAVCTRTDVSPTLATVPNGANIFFGINPTGGPARKNAGRGNDADVTRLAALPVDLDISEGKCPDYDTARVIIAELSEILGTEPSAITSSGGGLHPYWPISDGSLPRDRNGTAFKPLLGRWKRLVQQIAGKHGAKVDSIFDPARVLRAPATFNRKPESQGKPPIPVTCERGTGHALTMANVVDALDAYGIRDIEDFPDEATVKSDPETWDFGDETCPYAQAMIRGWADPNSVDAGVGRHQWLLKQATRLFCALSGGCITKDDFEHAKTVLVQTFTHLLTTRAVSREPGPGEILDALNFGVAKAATKTKDDARAELGDHEHDKPGRRSQATVLMDIAKDLFGFGVTHDGRVFYFEKDTPHVVTDLRRRSFGLRAILAQEYSRQFDCAASSSALSSAMDTLEGYAYGQIPETVYQRVAGDASEIYLDMADVDNRVIKITGGTWELAYESPYKFRRTELTAALPEPKRGGEIAPLWKHVNIFEDDRDLLICAAIDALIRPNTAKPILVLHGEQGSAKTATAKCFRALIDPSTAEMHVPPKDIGDLLVKASGGWLMAFDNVSTLSAEISDVLCALATGAGVTNRTLYTNFDLTVLKFRRSILFTAIHMERVRGDFADRTVAFKLPVIDGVSVHRQTEEDLDHQWTQDWPVVLGALLDCAAKVQRGLRTLSKPKSLPRMADFAKVLIAYDEINGTDSMKRYRQQLMAGLAQSTEGDSFVQHLIACEYRTSEKGATSAEIVHCIEQKFPELQISKPKDWPRSARAVTGRLRANAPALRQLGWSITDDEGKNMSNSVRFSIEPPRPDPETVDETS